MSAAHEEHADPLKTYLVIFATLMMLLFATVGAYYIPFEKLGESYGVLNTVLALIIATIKASLVVLFFMHLRHSTKLTWVIAGAGFVWLCIMITFFFADYLTRSSIPEMVHSSDTGGGPMAVPQVVHHDPSPFNGLG